jgi:hypothetical protein
MTIDQLLLLAAVGFFLLLVALEYLGSRLNLSQSRTAESKIERDRFTHVLASVFGLLALLLGFTFNMAVQRFDARTADVVAEANAIGSAHDLATLLGTDEGRALQAELRAYARQRLRFGDLERVAEVNGFLAASADHRNRIGKAALGAVLPVATTGLATSVMAAVDSVTDIGVAREAGMRARLPVAIFAVLVGFICLAITMTGYAFPHLNKGRSWGTTILSLLLVVTIFLIIDLDRPLGGSIVIDQSPMVMLVEGFNS